MSTINYTKTKEGLEKIRNIIDNEPTIVMMATRLDKIPFSVRPMTLQQMDKQGDLWFFTSKKSENFKDILDDNKVQIIYSDDKKHNYLSIFGNATQIVDKQKVHELWSPILLSWFEDENDPDLALLNINMEQAYYWDSNVNELVSFFEMIKSSINKEKPNLGNKGYIDLQNY
jgi:general stress protein 26